MIINKDYKQIYDAIHGYIKISDLACAIIDTEEFQRLKYLHQLGTCHYVFPNATHTRYEHSLGTYHLCGRMVDSIKKNTDPNMLNLWMDQIEFLEGYYKREYLDKGIIDFDRLDEYVTELVKIGGLCHDLGHGPFSHVFDDVFIPHVRTKNSPLELHENRSGEILIHIIKNSEKLRNVIGTDEIEFILKLINPEKHHFIYQIVSNSFNNIDVDKFDYMARDTGTLGLKFGFDFDRLINDARVINNIICYPKNIYYEIASMFKTRYRLHKQIYSHKMVISTQMMINDMMILINSIVGIFDSIFDNSEFCKMTDGYIIETVKFLYQHKSKFGSKKQDQIIEAYNIWENLNKRKLYKFIGSAISNKRLDIDYDRIKSLDPSIKEEEIVIYNSKIGFVGGAKKNPLDYLYLYESKTPDKCFKIRKEDVSYLISDIYQEYVVMFFVKNRDDTELIEKMQNIYGILKDIE